LTVCWKIAEGQGNVGGGMKFIPLPFIPLFSPRGTFSVRDQESGAFVQFQNGANLNRDLPQRAFSN
jgi:hypothetical protein